jgi:tetratricopeptide (TPR) repeat protein
MESELFWLQKALISQKEGQIEACVGYYLRGLRWNPTSTLLMYNLANSYKKLGKLQNAKLWFNLGVQIMPRWVDGQVGLAMTQFEMGDFPNAYNNVKQAREDSRGVDKNLAHELIPPLFSFKEISIFTATVCKCMGKGAEAERRYKHCLAEFKKKESVVISDIVFSLMFVPLMPDKKLLLD